MTAAAESVVVLVGAGWVRSERCSGTVLTSAGELHRYLLAPRPEALDAEAVARTARILAETDGCGVHA